jgi:hypothetical protein
MVSSPSYLYKVLIDILCMYIRAPVATGWRALNLGVWEVNCRYDKIDVNVSNKQTWAAVKCGGRSSARIVKNSELINAARKQAENSFL